VIELQTDAEKALTAGVHEGVLKGSGRMIVGSVFAAEMHRHRAVSIFFRGHVTDGDGVLGRFVKALGVVNRDRPESIDWHVLDRQAVRFLAVVPSG
jgi:hypothetical protein